MGSYSRAYQKELIPTSQKALLNQQKGLLFFRWLSCYRSPMGYRFRVKLCGNNVKLYGINVKLYERDVRVWDLGVLQTISRIVKDIHASDRSKRKPRSRRHFIIGISIS